MSSSKRILVLGNTSLISTAVISKLKSEGYIIDAAGRKASEDKTINFLKWDIFDENKKILSLLKNEYDTIVVSAWTGNEVNQRNNLEINMKCAELLKTQIENIVNKCVIKQIILMGSQAEYGEAFGKVDENYKVDRNTLSAYGKAKLFLYESLKNNLDSSIIITELRFHSVYGYHPTKKQMLSDIMEKIFFNQDVVFYSDGKHNCDYIEVSDAAEAVYDAIITKSNGIYNINSFEQKKFFEYINKMKFVSKSKSNIIYGSKKEKDLSFDVSKANQRLNWIQKVSFEDGISDMYSMKILNILKSTNIIIYGAGYCGLMFSDLLIENGIIPECFYDADIKKQGLTFNNIQIKKAEKCSNTNTTVIVCLLTDRYYDEIKSNLIKLGYKNIKYIYELSTCRQLFKNQPLIFTVPAKWYQINEKKLKEVSELFSDNISVETYSSIIKFVNGDHEVNFHSYDIKEQYFAYDIYKKIDNEVFVDCGAFRGDILNFFVQNNNEKFNSYYAIEPDPKNYSRIQKLQSANDERVKIILKALSDKKEHLYIKNYLNENSVISSNGCSVEAITLDEISELYKINPTFIKVDVEGYEEKLLDGSCRIIEKSKPIIAVAIYHKYDDLWKIPLKINAFLPKHKLFLRSYMNVNETVLYAIPEERLTDEIYRKL